MEHTLFEALSGKLTGVFDRLRTRGRLSETDVLEALREVRLALLDADVALPVVRDFITKVRERAVGQEVIDSVSPGQQVVKIVNDVLVEALGGEGAVPLNLNAVAPVPILMVGLQGSGKTTTSGKLALRLLKRDRKKILLASLDTQRPAAQLQLETLAKQAGVGSLPIIAGQTPLEIAARAMDTGRREVYDIVILDTAGRLQIDAELMDELKQIDKIVKPDECYLVVDAMIGQEAANVAKAFNDALELNACILTKLDGDARGGAALSIKGVTGVPIKFVGVGEKVDKLEDFVPERMAGRILGQGDLMGVVEKIANIQKDIGEEELKKQQEAMVKGNYTLEMFRDQFQMIAKMGMKDMMSRMPGMSEMIPEGEDPEEALKRVQGMIDSMTKAEKAEPDMIDTPRRRRIARGAGVEPHEVNQFLKQFDQIRGLMKQMAAMSTWQRLKMMTGMGKAGMFQPGGMAGLKTKGDTGKRKSAKERAEDRKKKKKH